MSFNKKDRANRLLLSNTNLILLFNNVYRSPVLEPEYRLFKIFFRPRGRRESIIDVRNNIKTIFILLITVILLIICNLLIK